nr:hypothetical protein [Candidatus Sigynarchaeum springense]
MSSITKRNPYEEARFQKAIQKLASANLPCWGCPRFSSSSKIPCTEGDMSACAPQCPVFVARPQTYTRRSVHAGY